MLDETMQQSLTWHAAMENTYGPLRVQDKTPIQVWACGSCSNPGTPMAAAGGGVYWGPLNPANSSVRVSGDKQDAGRGSLLAILRALDSADPRRALTIFTDSEYAIRSIAEWAPARFELGWSCPDGDLLRDIQLLIRRR
ncbi:hypothetical protein EXIGLDRAFT_561631, partial [Exidia glandulosa HHB12029]